MNLRTGPGTESAATATFQVQRQDCGLCSPKCKFQSKVYHTHAHRLAPLLPIHKTGNTTAPVSVLGSGRGQDKARSFRVLPATVT